MNRLLVICRIFVIMCRGKMRLHVYDCKFEKSFAICDNVYRENAFACI